MILLNFSIKEQSTINVLVEKIHVKWQQNLKRLNYFQDNWWFLGELRGPIEKHLNN